MKYVVWPPLFLYTGGPILCKGVAQGYSDISRRCKSVPDKNRKHEQFSKVSPECYNKSFGQTKLKMHGSAEKDKEHSRLSNTSADDSFTSKRERKLDTTKRDTPVSRQSRTRNKAKTLKQSKALSPREQNPTESDIDTFLRWREMFGHKEAKRLMGDDYDICLRYLSDLNII